MQRLELQKANFDCGPTALHSALKLYGRTTKFSNIIRWAGCTPEKGTSAAGLKRCLERLSVPFSEYNSRSRIASWKWARKQTMPSVLCFDNDEHWVLLVAGLNSTVLVFDPEVGFEIYKRKDFLARWITNGKVYAIQLRKNYD